MFQSRVMDRLEIAYSLSASDNSEFDIVEANTGLILVEDQINEIQTFASDRMIIAETGFLEIFLNNEAPTPVYFDNLKVVQTTGDVVDVTAYYPSGNILSGLSSSGSLAAYNLYKYNAKELQEELSLNWLDYGARMYDPAIGRWWVPDPLAEKYYGISPYAYCNNNPIIYIDPEGETPIALIGAIVGGIEEMVSQTISNGLQNLNDGRGFFNDWGKNMDWADVVISTAEGALAGLTLGGSLVVGGAALKSAVDWTGNDGLQFIGAEKLGLENNNKSLRDAGLDLLGEAVSFGIGKGVGIDKVGFDKGGFGVQMFGTTVKGSFSGVWGYGVQEGKSYLNTVIPQKPIELQGVAITPNGNTKLSPSQDKEVWDTMKRQGYKHWSR